MALRQFLRTCSFAKRSRGIYCKASLNYAKYLKELSNTHHHLLKHFCSKECSHGRRFMRAVVEIYINAVMHVLSVFMKICIKCVIHA